jgi:hypothetical protein
MLKNILLYNYYIVYDCLLALIWIQGFKIEKLKKVNNLR